jgi:DNA-binding NtrC family response regulator
MNIQEIIEKLNNREATRKELAEQLGISDSTLSRRIKSAGYDKARKKANHQERKTGSTKRQQVSKKGYL